MSNYAALALVSSASSSSSANNLNSTLSTTSSNTTSTSTTTNTTNLNSNILNNNNITNRIIGGIGNNGISLTSGHITPPNSGLNQLLNNINNLNNNSNNNNNTNNINQSNNLNSTNSNLTQTLLNQIANINLASSAPSPNRQNNQTINPFFRSNSTINNTNQQQTQQQQLNNLLQQQQQQLQQKKLAGSNLMNFSNNNANNSTMNTNNNLLNSTISRPQQQNTSQSLNPDSSIPPLDLSDFPVLHRQSNSPFQQQQLQQLQQQLRANNSLNFNQNAPNSAPILNSSLQSFMLQLQSAASTNSLTNQNSSATNLLINNLQFSNPNLTSLNQSVAANHGKMWSNFGSSKDRVSLKSQQSTTDNQHQEFNIQQEDFPALPRPQSVHNKTGSNVDNSGSDSTLKSTSNENSLNSLQLTNTSSTSSASNANMQTSSNVTKTSNLNSLNQNFSNLNNSAANKNVASNTTSLNNQSTVKKGIIISPDGRISNVPPNMLLDQFGMVGLLAYLRAADREKDFFALALGTDLTALGLNLNSSENLYHSFLSPFSDVPCRLQDIDFPVPTEYIINCQIKEKLAPIDVTRYSEDTLFYLFYMNGSDLMQLQAASALYDRDWRYHIEKRIWLTKVLGLEPQQKTSTFEKGHYTVFDVTQWRKVQLEMTIEYSKLAEKPQLPLQQVATTQATNSQTTPGSILPSVLQQQLHNQSTFTAPTSAALASLNSNPTSASSF